MNRNLARLVTRGSLALVLALGVPLDHAHAVPVAVSGVVTDTETIIPNSNALSNPVGPGESRGIIEVNLGVLDSLLALPGAEIGPSTFSLVGVQFTHPKTFEVRSYAADVALTSADFGAGGPPALSLGIGAPTELTITLDVTDILQDLVQKDATGIGFNLRESESAGHALIATEWVFVATILVLGVVTGLATVQTMVIPDGVPGGFFGEPHVVVTTVPEPGALFLVLLAAVALIAVGYHYRGRARRRSTATAST